LRVFDILDVPVRLQADLRQTKTKQPSKADKASKKLETTNNYKVVFSLACRFCSWNLWQL